jgi:DNA-directed RNA polymerase specialized sigma24 family protein
MPEEAPDPEVIDRLNNQDWEDLYEDLVAYATVRVQELSWERGSEALPEGKQPEDFVEEAIESLYTGRRTWNYEKYPNLKAVLRGIIDSLISNLVTSAEHRRSQDIEDSDSRGFYEDITSDKSDAEIRAEDIRERMRLAVADDPKLEMVFEAMLEGFEISEIENLIDEDRNRVYQLRRKVKRRIRKAPSVPEKSPS